MLVRLLTSRAGPTGFYLEGDTLDLPEAEARRMIAARMADPLPESFRAAPERADAAPPAESRIQLGHHQKRK